MATSADATQKFKDKFTALGKEGTLEYIKKNADFLKDKPEIAKAISSIYTEVFTGVKTPTTSLSTPLKSAATSATPVITTTTTPTTTTTTPTPTTTTTTPTTTTTTPTTIITPTAPIASTLGFDHSKTITSVPGSFTPAAFKPTTVKNGVAVNVDGRSTQQTYGLIKEQEKFLLKLDKQNVAKGLSVTERQAASNQAIKDLQQLNTNAQTYGKLPTQFKDTVGDLADLNNNGIPDAQEGFGLGAKSLASTIIGLVTGKTYNIPTNFNQLESTVAEVATEFANKTIDLKKKLAAADIEVKNANAKRVIDTNNAMIGNIQTMLGERVEQNKQQYVDAVSGVYRQLGGQVKQFQRIIGADGVAIDDATMLSLMGGVGVDSMAKIVDLKNVLVNDYLKQKEGAIKDIYALEKNNDLTANEAATAVAAITAQAEVDVLDLTKTFYQEMFGMAKSDFERTQTTTANTRNAVDSYLANIGITPLQRNQIINNYVKAGYTTEEAITKLSQDIRDGTNPVINDVTKNNADAAASANAKFTQEMALKITPIVTEGKIKLELQDDKQEFDAAQNALDRSRRASEAKSKTKAPKTLSEGAMINANKQVTARGGAPFTGNETVVDVLNIGYASQVLARPDEHTVEDVQDATTYMKGKGFQESDLIGTEGKQKMSSLTTGISKVIVVPNVEVTPIEVQ